PHGVVAGTPSAFHQSKVCGTAGADFSACALAACRATAGADGTTTRPAVSTATAAARTSPARIPWWRWNDTASDVACGVMGRLREVGGATAARAAAGTPALGSVHDHSARAYVQCPGGSRSRRV